MVWVAIGDSITYLNDHLDETGNRVTKGYLARVSEKLPNVHYINKGYNGWTAVAIATKIEDLGLPKADVYSILLGTNDWYQGKTLGCFNDYKNNTGTGTVCGSFRIIINKLHSLNAAAKIILMTPMQRTDFVQVANFNNNAHGSYKEMHGQSLSQFASAIDSIGSFEHFEVIDLYHDKDLSISKLVKFKRLKDPHTGLYKNYTYPGYLDIPFNPATDEYPYPVEAIGMTYDGLHPSDKGNEKIASKLVKIMKDY
jgi:lysophospholipase L1-like esterase